MNFSCPKAVLVVAAVAPMEFQRVAVATKRTKATSGRTVDAVIFCRNWNVGLEKRKRICEGICGSIQWAYQWAFGTN